MDSKYEQLNNYYCSFFDICSKQYTDFFFKFSAVRKSEEGYWVSDTWSLCILLVKVKILDGGLQLTLWCYISGEMKQENDFV